MVSFAQSLSVVDAQAPLDLLRLASDLVGLANKNFTSNALAMPVFQTLNILLEEDIFQDLDDYDDGRAM